jgi:uncharacterized SAM-binding protein YcdF (DUF218 family)
MASGQTMYNFASKFLTLLIDPFNVALLLAAGGLLCWRRRALALRLLAGSMFFFVVFACPETSLVLTRSLEDRYRDTDVARIPEAQAIIILGGTIHQPSQEHHASGLTESSDRLLLAYRLYRAGKAPLVICSGGNNPLLSDTQRPSEALSMSGLLEEWGIPAAAIEVEEASINTRENALFSYRLLSGRGIRKIILVTSAMHMPRAAGAFHKAGFEVVPAPADFRTGWGAPNPVFLWLPSAGSLDHSQTALHEWLGLWTYRLRGWA